MGLPGSGSDKDDVLGVVGDLVTRIEALLKELRKVVDDETGRQP